MDQIPRVAVVVLNWRGAEDTIACFRSIAELDYGLFDIYLCDNDSQDGSFETILTEASAATDAINAARAAAGRPGFTFCTLAPDPAGLAVPVSPSSGRIAVIQTGRNGGYAFGNNVGLRLAMRDSDARYFWILNNDTTVHPGALRELVNLMEGEPEIGLCGALVAYLEEPDRVQTLGGGRFLPMRSRAEQIGTGLTLENLPGRAEVEAQLGYVNGAAAFARRELLEQAGLMDEGYFLYWEELDWAERAQAMRFRLGYCPAARVFHRVGAQTGSSDDGGHSPSATYYMDRSKFRFLRLRHPGLLPLSYLLLAKACLTRLLKGDVIRARAALRGALGASWKG